MTAAIDLPRWFTPPQIARELGTKPSTILRWIRRGELTAVNIGSGAFKPRFRVSRDAFDKFLLSRTVQPPTPTPRRRRADPAVIQFF